MSSECSCKKQSFLAQSVSVLQSTKAGTAITLVSALFLAICVSLPAQAETVIVSTLAGSNLGSADGQGGAAQFHSPAGIAIDAAGNLYVADMGNHRIRKVTNKGEVSTLAGRGRVGGFVDGQGSDAWFKNPYSIAIDATGNLYVADTMNNSIRRVTGKGEVSTFAGNGKWGFADGQGNAAQFNRPSGIVIDATGNFYVADKDNHRIRKVTAKGEVSTLAGGERGFADGQGSAAQFYEPSGITIDAAGNLYVTDRYNNSIRKVTSEGKVSTLAGGIPANFAEGKGNVARSDNPVGITIEGKASTPVGRRSPGFADGKGSTARFNEPNGIVIDRAGNLYVSDTQNDRIRKVTPEGVVSTLAGSGSTGGDTPGGFADGEGSVARFHAPTGIAMDAAGNLYVADMGNERIRKIVIRP
ncbi:MAG: hypothetical protein LBQ75_00100 [Zoogloeaceae bacterium]|nr:hypothetical protein [Zoogloeaceae bacterium]